MDYLTPLCTEFVHRHLYILNRKFSHFEPHKSKFQLQRSGTYQFHTREGPLPMQFKCHSKQPNRFDWQYEVLSQRNEHLQQQALLASNRFGRNEHETIF